MKHPHSQVLLRLALEYKVTQMLSKHGHLSKAGDWGKAGGQVGTLVEILETIRSFRGFRICYYGFIIYEVHFQMYCVPFCRRLT